MPLARYTVSLVATVFAIMALSAAAHAQTYPAKPITVIIPFGAGGGTDAVARILQEDIR